MAAAARYGLDTSLALPRPRPNPGDYDASRDPRRGRREADPKPTLQPKAHGGGYSLIRGHGHGGDGRASALMFGDKADDERFNHEFIRAAVMGYSQVLRDWVESIKDPARREKYLRRILRKLHEELTLKGRADESKRAYYHLLALKLIQESSRQGQKRKRSSGEHHDGDKKKKHT